VNEKNLENQKSLPDPWRGVYVSACKADYFFRFSCFFQSALKHRLDCSFLWFVSFEQAKEPTEGSSA